MTQNIIIRNKISGYPICLIVGGFSLSVLFDPEPFKIINYLLVQDKDLWHLLLQSRPSFLHEHLLDEQSPLH
jgi:hypothetical protein